MPGVRRIDLHASEAVAAEAVASDISCLGADFVKNLEPFIVAVEQAVAAKNYYAALAISLTLPDVCANLETPGAKTRDRYIAWVTKYLMSRYPKLGSTLGPQRSITPEDFYALRCSYLHEGTDDLTTQRIQTTLKAFRFVEPGGNSTVHSNYMFGALQIQVDIFCRDICDGVREWGAAKAQNQEVQKRFAALLEIMPSPFRSPY